MGFPKDPNLKGLAAVTFHSDIPSWEFDIRAVPPGTEPLEVSDWHRRYGRANQTGNSSERAAKARLAPIERSKLDDSQQ